MFSGATARLRVRRGAWPRGADLGSGFPAPQGQVVVPHGRWPISTAASACFRRQSGSAAQTRRQVGRRCDRRLGLGGVAGRGLPAPAWSGQHGAIHRCVGRRLAFDWGPLRVRRRRSPSAQLVRCAHALELRPCTIVAVDVVAAEIVDACAAGQARFGLADRRWRGADIEKIIRGQAGDDGDDEIRRSLRPWPARPPAEAERQSAHAGLFGA